MNSTNLSEAKTRQPSAAAAPAAADATKPAQCAPAARATAEDIQRIRDNVPAELLTLPRWVCWDGARRPDGRLDKTPLNPRNGRKAMTNKPNTWAAFDIAVGHALGNNTVGGLGLVLTNSDYWALDFDHVFVPDTGALCELARRFLAAVTPSYLEISPSGDGLHCIYRGARPAALNRTQAKHAFGDGKHLEVFGGTSSRYLTMTGRVWEAS